MPIKNYRCSKCRRNFIKKSYGAFDPVLPKDVDLTNDWGGLITCKESLGLCKNNGKEQDNG